MFISRNLSIVRKQEENEISSVHIYVRTYLWNDDIDGVFELLPDGLLDDGRLSKPSHQEQVTDGQAVHVSTHVGLRTVDVVVVVVVVVAVVGGLGKYPVNVLKCI